MNAVFKTSRFHNFIYDIIVSVIISNPESLLLESKFRSNCHFHRKNFGNYQETE